MKNEYSLKNEICRSVTTIFPDILNTNLYQSIENFTVNNFIQMPALGRRIRILDKKFYS